MVLTAFADDDSVFAALRAGARGYLTKNAGAGEILQALSAVCAGEAQLDPSVQRRLVEAVVSGEAPGGPGTRAGRRPEPAGRADRSGNSRCSPRSGRACPTPRSRDKLRISGATVKSHINHLLAKTGSRDRGQLVGYAFRHGLAA